MTASDGIAAEGLRARGTRIVCLEGGSVRYRDVGHGTPVLLIHGIGRSLEDWIEQHEAMAERGYRTISVDLPGFGESEPLQVPNSLSALADFVVRFLDALEITEKVHVVGNSLGGAVAMQLSLQAPDRVRTFILADSAGFGREVAASVRLLSIRPLGRVLLARPSRKSARRLERSLFHDKSFVTDERVELNYRLSMRPRGTEVFLETASALGGIRGVHVRWREILVSAMADRKIPTLVVWGDRDRIFPVSQLAAARQLIPHALTHVLPNTGHMPHIERADEFCSLATDFWNSLKEDS